LSPAGCSTKAVPRTTPPRPFPEDPAAERALVARGTNVVLNELAVKRLGFGTPQQAIGKTFKTLVNPEYGGLIGSTVIGVVQDSRFRSIREPIDPIIYTHTRQGQGWMLIRYNTADPSRLRRDVEQCGSGSRRTCPSRPSSARRSWASSTRPRTPAPRPSPASRSCRDRRLPRPVRPAAFTAERRTKEIGIRKVLGARSQDIVRLLAWQFSKPVIVANLIAWPVAWWVMRDWLNNFDARIDLGPTPFVMAGLLALAIAIAPVAGHALKVARSNPDQCAEYE
jgi:putative ABC transport system permease protein